MQCVRLARTQAAELVPDGPIGCTSAVAMTRKSVHQEVYIPRNLDRCTTGVRRWVGIALTDMDDWATDSASCMFRSHKNAYQRSAGC